MNSVTNLFGILIGLLTISFGASGLLYNLVYPKDRLKEMTLVDYVFGWAGALADLLLWNLEHIRAIARNMERPLVFHIGLWSLVSLLAGTCIVILIPTIVLGVVAAGFGACVILLIDWVYPKGITNKQTSADQFIEMIAES